MSSDFNCILENQCPGEPLTTEGLYRVSGDKTKIASLIQLLQRSEYENISRQALENEISFHEITGLIKNYLRTMEEPLLLFKFYKDFVSIGKTLGKLSGNSKLPSQKILTRSKREYSLLKRLPKATI